MSSREVFIVSAARTPIGSFNGSLSSLPASDLGAVVIKAVLERANVDPKDVNEVILGQSLTAGQGQNPARQASIKAGVPLDAAAYGINMLCGSGLKTVSLGTNAIRAGDADIVIAGGQESMSKAPHVVHLRDGVKMGNTPFVDSMLNDGLTDAFHNIHMGLTAENLAREYSISRAEQDAQAEKSQNQAEAAQTAGYFDAEIAPVEIKTRRETKVFARDEYIKFGTTLEALSKLRPCFIPADGTVTPGNASGINDSAAAVLLMSGEEVKKRGVAPLAKVLGFTQSGCDPKVMGIGPVGAIQKLLSKVGWKLEDVDLFELNEAFAAQALAVNKGLGVDPAKVNIHGGAIALGHPIGASGCRVLVTLIYALKRTGGKRGIASLCVGGGMGVALAIEMV